MGALFVIILSLLAIFLILLILVQRGRGGGLAGALGGMGGSSAFGAKAGDVFTRITIITASIWIALCLIAVFWAKHGGDALTSGSSRAPASAPLNEPSGQSAGRTPLLPNQPAPSTGQSQPQAEAPAATGPAESAESDGAAPPANEGAAGTAPANNQ